MMLFGRIIYILKEAKSVTIFPHISADGDALGSCFALGLALTKMGKQVEISLEESVPSMYQFMPGISLTHVFDGSAIKSEIAVALDTGDIQRLGTRAENFGKMGITVNIDHHPTNTKFAKYNFIDHKASASGEIVYQIIKLLGVEMDLDIANCLYVAIAADTGGFRFSNTTSNTHEIVAEIIRFGVDVSGISKRIFDRVSLQKLKLTSIAIDRLEIYENGKVAVITLPGDVIRSVGARDEDCDGLVNIGRNVVGVEVSILLKEAKNGEIKANFRSNYYVDVAKIASKYSGGGHKMASGAVLSGRMEDVLKMLLEDVRSEIGEDNRDG